MRINQKTTLNSVIGHPLAHTQSPALHNHVYTRLQLNTCFLAFAHESLAPLIQAIRTLNVGLTAVTMPFKEQVLPYLEVPSAAVQALHSANTLIQKAGKLYGYNTDVDGIQYALRHCPLNRQKVLVLGTGGAARALGYVLNQQDAQIFWLNRTVEKAAALARDFGGEVLNPARVQALDYLLIVNTTPIGLYPHTQESPLKHFPFNASQTVFDMVYNPSETLLLKQASAAGAQTISGLDMFIAQGLRQIELWTEQPLITDELVEELRKLLA